MDSSNSRFTAQTIAQWGPELPVLRGERTEVRELEVDDAPALYRILSLPDVKDLYSPPPATVSEFADYIRLAHQRRQQGRYVSFAVVNLSTNEACGLFQLRRLLGTTHAAEWGFALDPSVWGSGMFEESASLIVRFAFTSLQLHRLEARVLTSNKRAAMALMKLGASPEGVLRQSFEQNGRFLDQTMWSIIRPEDRA